MPYDALGLWVDSKTDLITYILGFGEIGGVGQLVYKLFRFKKYELRYIEDGRILACPMCRPGYEVTFATTDSLTGAELLADLYNLAFFCLDVEFAHFSADSATGTLSNYNFTVHIDKLEFK